MNETIKSICKKYNLSAYEAQTIYTRYCEKADLPEGKKLLYFDFFCQCYAATGIRWLLHEPENFDVETDRG